MIRAIIFDFDGLMVNTEVPVYNSLRTAFQQHGTELPLDVWLKGIGSTDIFDPFAYLEEQVGYEIDKGQEHANYHARARAEIQNEPLLPGVEQYLNEAIAMGLQLAVASSSSRAWVEGHLRNRNALQYFDYTCCSDDVKSTKPNPALFLLALQKLSIPASDAIVLEDSINGVRAANAAGIFTVAVPGPLTQHLDFHEADLRLGSLADLSLASLIANVEQMQSSYKDNRFGIRQ